MPGDIDPTTGLPVASKKVVVEGLGEFNTPEEAIEKLAKSVKDNKSDRDKAKSAQEEAERRATEAEQILERELEKEKKAKSIPTSELEYDEFGNVKPESIPKYISSEVAKGVSKGLEAVKSDLEANTIETQGIATLKGLKTQYPDADFESVEKVYSGVGVPYLYQMICEAIPELKTLTPEEFAIHLVDVAKGKYRRKASASFVEAPTADNSGATTSEKLFTGRTPEEIGHIRGVMKELNLSVEDALKKFGLKKSGK